MNNDNYKIPIAGSAKGEVPLTAHKTELAVEPAANSLLGAEKTPDQAALNLMGFELSQFLDSNPVPTFVINNDHVITHWNKACEHILGYSSASMVQTRRQWVPFYRSKRPVLADLIIGDDSERHISEFYSQKYKGSQLIKGAYEADDFFPNLGLSGLWIHFTAAPLYNSKGEIVGAIESLEDITERREAESALRQAHDNLESLVKKRTAQLAADIRQRETVEHELIRRNTELTELNAQLSKAQEQLLQSEKLASIGQLAAGVAHEINNPVGYIFSNFGTLENYMESLFQMLQAYEESEQHISAPEVAARLKQLRDQIELDFLKEDIPVLMQQSKEGIVRVRKIVQDLKDFSRVDNNQEWQWANLHQGIDSTLNIVNNEIKYKADVIKDYGPIPDIECLPSQINQVIMNLVVNASHAIGNERGTIRIRTRVQNDTVSLEVSDTGCGIPKELVSRIFDPFFTTKPIGKGTGLGLSLSYGIVKKHNGQILVSSEAGKGTVFTIVLPIRHVDNSSSSHSHESSEQ